MQKQDVLQEMQAFMSGSRDMLTIHQDTADGFMNMTAYGILPGIFLTFNDVHTQTLPGNKEHMPSDMLLINYCIQGRCEFKMDDDSYSYVDTRLMTIASRMVQDSFYYPSSFYTGYEVYILPSLFTDETRETLKWLHLDPKTLLSLYTKGVAFHAPDSIVRLWNHITEHRQTEDIGQIRLDTLQLIKYFYNNRQLNTANTLYLSRVQIMLAKKAQKMLTRDLSQHPSMKSIAQSLGVSETSLKRYFRLVFGANLSTYMNEIRMKYAASLLTSSKDSISDIARCCGYANQGRFASVFREFYGMKPLDYRRKYHEQN